MKIYKKCAAKRYSYLVVDTTFSSDNPLGFRKNPLKKIYNKIMTIDDQIRNEKPQYDINRKAVIILALSSTKLISMNILQVKKYSHIIKNKICLFSFRKSFSKTNKKN